MDFNYPIDMADINPQGVLLEHLHSLSSVVLQNLFGESANKLVYFDILEEQRLETLRLEAEAFRTEALRVEALRVEAFRAEAFRVEALRVEALQAESLLQLEAFQLDREEKNQFIEDNERERDCATYISSPLSPISPVNRKRRLFDDFDFECPVKKKLSFQLVEGVNIDPSELVCDEVFPLEEKVEEKKQEEKQVTKKIRFCSPTREFIAHLCTLDEDVAFALLGLFPFFLASSLSSFF